MAVIKASKTTKVILKTLAGVGALWILVSVVFIRTSSDDSRPVELRR